MVKMPNKYGLITGVALGAFSFIAPTNAQSQTAELQQDFETFTNEVGQARATNAAFLDTGIENGGRISAIAGEVLIGPGKIIEDVDDTRFEVGFINTESRSDAIKDGTLIEKLNLGANNSLPIKDVDTNLEGEVIRAINNADFNATQANALVRNFQNSRSNQQARITGAGFLDTSAENGGRISAIAGEIELAPGQTFDDGDNDLPFARVGIDFQLDRTPPFRPSPFESENIAILDVFFDDTSFDPTSSDDDVIVVERANPLQLAVANVVNELVNEEDFSPVQVNALVDAFGAGSSNELGQARATSAAFLDTGIENGGRISAIAGEVEFGPGILIDLASINTGFSSDFANLDDDSEIADDTVISNLYLGQRGVETRGSSLNALPVFQDFDSEPLEARVFKAINSNASSANPANVNALVRNFQNNQRNTQPRITGAGFLDTGEQDGGRISTTAGELELAPGQAIAATRFNDEFTAKIGLEFQGNSGEVNTALNEVNLEIAEGRVLEANVLEEGAVADIFPFRDFFEEDLSSVQVNALVDAFGGGSSSEDLALD